VYARGNWKQLIYVDDRDRAVYLDLLGETVRRYAWRCLAFCLMDNHVHLMVETEEANLGSGMQRMHGRYAQAFNVRHRRTGHLFQGRFGSVRVKSDAQLLLVARYIARNPVTAGLCEDPALWPWSSHQAVLTGTFPAWLDVPRLLEYFASDGGDGLRRYGAFVGVAIDHAPFLVAA
jgi:REP element-mobilizing transposase RayT